MGNVQQPFVGIVHGDMEPTWYYVWIWLVQNNKLMGWWRDIMRITLSIIYIYTWAFTSQGDVRCQGQRSVSEAGKKLWQTPFFLAALKAASGVWIQRCPNSWISPLSPLKIEQSSGTSTWLLHFPSSLLFPSPFSFTRPCFITYKYFQYDVISYHK